MLKAYELTSSRANQLLTSSPGNMEWLLELSPREKAIVEHPKSSFIIGRSGVGETTGNYDIREVR